MIRIYGPSSLFVDLSGHKIDLRSMVYCCFFSFSQLYWRLCCRSWPMRPSLVTVHHIFIVMACAFAFFGFSSSWSDCCIFLFTRSTIVSWTSLNYVMSSNSLKDKVTLSRCYARAWRTRRDHGGLGPKSR